MGSLDDGHGGGDKASADALGEDKPRIARTFSLPRDVRIGANHGSDRGVEVE